MRPRVTGVFLSLAGVDRQESGKGESQLMLLNWARAGLAGRRGRRAENTTAPPQKRRAFWDCEAAVTTQVARLLEQKIASIAFYLLTPALYAGKLAAHSDMGQRCLLI